MKPGKYKLKKDITVRVNNAVMAIIKGTNVIIKQHDKKRRQVLIDFKDGYIDWFGELWVSSYLEALDN